MVEMLVCQYRFRLGSVQTFCLQIFLVELKFNSSMRMDNEWDGVGKKSFSHNVVVGESASGKERCC